jgi:hypothetical protein
MLRMAYVKRCTRAAVGIDIRTLVVTTRESYRERAM